MLGGAAAGTARAEGNLGLGIIAGEPTGISMKLWTSNRTALDGAVAWSFDEAVHLHADYLWHFFDRFDIDEGYLPLYVGVGGRTQLHDVGKDELGFRIPFGASYLFENAPVDIFGEVAPVMNVAPDTELKAEGAIGVRYFFGDVR
ncbi:MAG: hypothetical protein KC729_05705 [Candidatus Eisenbacteria bacterium]|uniref:Uncharacterized protein n=1 Tax=Eiseniibacteriota bacterium TaxID=2212470 RepID=A0A956LZM6_UNCEI|nr:hypothetical protein [Candidatus Eisenbacteria bacterium]